MNRRANSRTVLLLLLAVAALAVLFGASHWPPRREAAHSDAPAAPSDAPRPKPTAGQNEGGRLERINGYLVLHVEGTPEQMGEQHGRLLRDQIRKACRALIHDSYPGEAYDRLIEGTREMEKHQPDAFRRELRALADAAGIDYWDSVAMQLFGDVDRGLRPAWSATDGGMWCTSYAVFGPATKTGELIVGRNMDFYDAGVGEYGAILMHVTPDEGRPFVTVTWAGIINGWTLMNDRGLVTANNSAFGGANSLRGISTCFLLRKVAQFAADVEQGVEIVRRGPRACGTNMLIAGPRTPAAAIVEFDHEQVAVRRARDGYVLAANSFRKLGGAEPFGDTWGFTRYGKLEKLIREHHGEIDRSMNFAGARGVPMSSNLHSAMLFPGDLIIRVSMGKIPAYEHPYIGFRMTDEGLVAENDEDPEP